MGSRVKLCYNQVVGDGFKSAHKLLQQALAEDKIELALIPNGIIPIVDPRLAAQAVNSDRREDILIWRYRKEKLEELGPFADALLGFASHFVPAVREGASRVGLIAKMGKQEAQVVREIGMFDIAGKTMKPVQESRSNEEVRTLVGDPGEGRPGEEG